MVDECRQLGAQGVCHEHIKANILFECPPYLTGKYQSKRRWEKQISALMDKAHAIGQRTQSKQEQHR